MSVIIGEIIVLLLVMVQNKKTDARYRVLKIIALKISNFGSVSIFVPKQNAASATLLNSTVYFQFDVLLTVQHSTDFFQVTNLTLWRRNFLLNFSTHCI